MRRLVLPCLAILLLSLVVVAIRGGDSSRPAHHAAVVVASRAEPDPVAQLGAAEAIVGYVQAVQAQQVSDYLHAANDAAVAAYIASLPPIPAPAPARSAPAPAPVVASPAPSAGAVGSCTGFAVPDYIIQRESGGDPNAVNPSSGAIGCSQTLPQHYQSGGACAGLDMHTVDGQRQCTWILSDGGTNLAPWAL